MRRVVRYLQSVIFICNTIQIYAKNGIIFLENERADILLSPMYAV